MKPQPGTASLLTHAHTGRTGFAEQARATTGARVWVHELDAEMVRTGKAGPRDGKTSAYQLRARSGVLCSCSVLEGPR